MEILIKKLDDFKTSLWAGGTTTELAIYPKYSNYGDRDFVWRLSSATVELWESDFTSLPDYDRVLIVLKGQVKLVHKDLREVVLNELEQDCFSGGYETKSFGKIKDFNLMIKKGNRGFAQVIDLTKGDMFWTEKAETIFPLRSECFYCVEGWCEVSVNDVKKSLNSGELFVSTGKVDEYEFVGVAGKGKVIRTSIYFE